MFCILSFLFYILQESYICQALTVPNNQAQAVNMLVASCCLQKNTQL